MAIRGPQVICVLDASAAASWVLPDESTDHGLSLLDRVATDGAIVPAVWHLEMMNVLLTAERRQRLTAVETNLAYSSFRSLPITVDAFVLTSFDHVLSLSRNFGLASYDAAYLELALRTGLPLACNDKKLAAAAGTAGVLIWNGESSR